MTIDANLLAGIYIGIALGFVIGAATGMYLYWKVTNETD